jgi:hypothetical protein
VASTTVEETGMDLESFRTKNEMTRDGLLFIGSKLSAAVYKIEPLLIDSSLKPLLMKLLSAMIQD